MFHALLYNQVLEDCNLCKERWFEMKLNGINEYSRCVTDRNSRKRPSGFPLLMSAENNMNTGTVPLSLSETTQVEEMLIIRIYFYVEV